MERLPSCSTWSKGRPVRSDHSRSRLARHSPPSHHGHLHGDLQPTGRPFDRWSASLPVLHGRKAGQSDLTILGPAWHVIRPLLTTVIFTVIFNRLAGLSTDGAPPFLFYMVERPASPI